MFECYNCKKPQDSLFVALEEKLYCKDCYDSLFFICDICQYLKNQESELDLTGFADARGLLMVCEKCVDEALEKSAGEERYGHESIEY